MITFLIILIIVWAWMFYEAINAPIINDDTDV
jgi:hypothetical protein